jgi:hypothetical protein
MLQRIQSVWLLFACICSFAGLKFSVYSGITDKYNEINGFSTVYTTIITIAIAVIAAITIFLYNNRNLQIRLIITGILLELLLAYLYYREILNFTQGTYSLTALLQVATLIFFILAIRGIRKDNKIIKESDRLR